MNKIQPSFSAGELAPSLQCRSDINKYASGLSTCRNFIPKLEGGVSRRNGTRYINTTKTQGDSVKLVPFQVSNSIGYTLEFGDEYIRFYKDKGILSVSSADAWTTPTAYVIGDYVTESATIYYCIEAHTSGTFATDLAAGKWTAQTQYEIPTVYDSDDLELLDYRQSADILFIAHPDYPTYQLIRNGDVNWSFEIFDYDIPPFMLSNSDVTHDLNVSAVYGSANLVSSTSFFDTQQVGSYFKIFHDIGGQSVKKVFSGTGASTSIQCKGTWRIRSFGATCDLDIDVEKSFDNGASWEVIRSFTILNTEIDSSGEIDNYSLVRLNCTSYSSGNTTTLTTEAFSHAGIFEATGFTSDTVLSGTVITQFASTDTSYDWAESSWSEYRGYPSCLTFYQDRLCFGNTYTEPQTIWMSQTGNYYNFDISDPLLDSDKISIQLASRRLNGINNLIYLNDIVVLTTADEWRVGGIDGSAISPTNIIASVQGNRGSSNISPVIIGNKIIYPQASSSIIRDLGYDFNSNSFTGENISVLSNHFFEGYTIVDMDYAAEPNSTVYMTRDDGKLITLTYMKEQEIIGFASHDTDGTFENVSVIINDNKYEVWCIVKRGDNRFVEVFEEVQTDVTDQWFLDSALSYDGVSTTTISGLDHLEGETVDVLADGSVVRELTVASGEITLPNAATKAIVGLRFVSDFESLPLVFNFDNGTTKDKKMRSHQCTFVFENTRGGWVGDPSVGTITDTSHTGTLTESIQIRTFMDLPIDLFTGQISFNLNSAWGLDRKIFYRQYDPLPVNILAIIPRIQIGG